MSLSRLKSNLLIPLSALCFFCLEAKTDVYLVGIPVATLVVAALMSREEPMKDAVKGAPKALLAYCVLTAMGICYAGKLSLVDYLSSSEALGAMFSGTVLGMPAANLTAWVLAAGSLIAVFYVLLRISTAVIAHFKEARIIEQTARCERVVFLVLFVVIGAIATFAYVQSNAYYGTENPYNVIYSSDSSSIFMRDTFLVITQSHNDIRQPLFAVFAAPFVGLPYLLTAFIPDHMLIRALLYNYVQLAMLISSFFLIAQTMDFTAKQRAAFVAGLSPSFLFLLYVFALEQYIVAFFWLAFSIHLLLKGTPNVLAIVSTAGTLLVGAAASLFVSDSKNVKERVLSIVYAAISFFVAMLAFCRLDIFITLVKQIKTMIRYTTMKLTLPEKAYQFFCFVSDCFFAPPSHELYIYEFPSWWFDDTTTAFALGIAIFAICMLSFAINWRKCIARFALVWICLSLLMLVIIGWGTGEGCLVLYCLYFGWPYAVLLALLFDFVSKKIGKPWLFFACLGALAIVMLVVNVPGFMGMIDFANTRYPL